MKKLIALIMMSVMLVACGERKDFLEALSAYIDQLHGAGVYTGEIVKKKAERDGYFVVAYTNTSGTVEYLALNYKNWEKGTVIDATWVMGALTDGTIVFVSNNGDGTYTDGTYTYETTAASVKDLETVAAMNEAFAVQQSAARLVSEFGLSEARSFEVAKLVNAYKKVSNRRSMTEADANLFSMEVFGASMNAVEKAFNGQGDVNVLLEKAAAKNGVSPEHMNRLVQEFILR